MVSIDIKNTYETTHLPACLRTLCLHIVWELEWSITVVHTVVVIACPLDKAVTACCTTHKQTRKLLSRTKS